MTKRSAESAAHGNSSRSTWTLSTIATAGDSGDHASLGMTATGGVRISDFHKSDNSLPAIIGP